LPIVILSPPGTPGRYSEIGSSRASLPSCTSCRITVDVMVLVMLPTPKWSSIVSGSFASIVAVPKMPDQLQRSARMVVCQLLEPGRVVRTWVTYVAQTTGAIVRG
jgi:hypothetical protein